MPLTQPQRERLELARKRLDKPHNWIQCASKRGNCYCLLGAIFTCSVERLTVKEQESLCRHVIQVIQDAGYPYVTIPQFNDQTNRTYEQVIKVLDRAIETA